ncbi:ABC transporter permease [Cytobacillus spongiae]|uniref:ABC transporter permease n=1 Tax=Cytobacillus spongiae TaxID=2901381 RepID=UPI001F28CF51|nr:ABC transporter permease [Cytobacillus spongiae]UII55815.1 ABC transporter permease [Cytobacillus spongiae]
MLQLLTVDLLKIKRKFIWFFIFLGPIGVIGLEAVNFTLRYEYLTGIYAAGLWEGLIDNVRYLAHPTLIIGVTIIISMIANIEHQTNAWKQLLALPIDKKKVFAGKFLVSAVLLFVSCTLLAIGTVFLGIALKFGFEFPVTKVLQMAYFPFFATMPIIALQVWLSISMKNQATPLTAGIVGMIVSLSSMGLPDWFPYKWPSLENNWGNPIYSVMAGMLVGVIVFTIGLLDFSRKDVK